ncbi:uncharacterized protein YbcV (DUF1398 family) [Anseongella ginsenosidimutans]|uniref:Uncharacterized protein YbcV (DUF1398 family) n=1 Tax=Anseongella ginsenosidimutans TaxID=496056 RepID=A0A4R3KWX0_9SPHI|nr:DUF1398 family protein [Anseongella ginsenosidimutans]QEC53519.1 DUF1398 domain-containing protein [Anseongella ginsenosidimutans]TCS88421.1 uncharacterized protein YbcV (DUF1398 family) [Anseongella ginsenosidimutans]
MFTLEQVKKALAKVKTGADFPAYVQELKKLGVTWYETFVSDVHSNYHGENGYTIPSPPIFAPVEIADVPSESRLREAIKKHQAGETGFPTIRQQAANAGVHKWKVDIQALTCTYYDRAGHVILVEEIPIPASLRPPES